VRIPGHEAFLDSERAITLSGVTMPERRLQFPGQVGCSIPSLPVRLGVALPELREVLAP